MYIQNTLIHLSIHIYTRGCVHRVCIYTLTYKHQVIREDGGILCCSRPDGLCLTAWCLNCHEWQGGSYNCPPQPCSYPPYIVRRMSLHYALQHTITHCNTLQHTATHCNTLQHTVTHCNDLQHTATHCSTLQHTATHCNTLQQLQHTVQHSAIQCNTLQHTATHCNTLSCNTLQHTATHCNTLQYTAIHCNTLQHTILQLLASCLSTRHVPSLLIL